MKVIKMSESQLSGGKCKVSLNLKKSGLNGDFNIANKKRILKRISNLMSKNNVTLDEVITYRVQVEESSIPIFNETKPAKHIKTPNIFWDGKLYIWLYSSKKKKESWPPFLEPLYNVFREGHLLNKFFPDLNNRGSIIRLIARLERETNQKATNFQLEQLNISRASVDGAHNYRSGKDLNRRIQV